MGNLYEHLRSKNAVNLYKKQKQQNINYYQQLKLLQL
jgi:hypothetical protein